MTRLTRAWNAFLTDPGPPQEVDLQDVNVVLAFAHEPLSGNALHIVAAQPIGVQSEFALIQPPVCIDLLPDHFNEVVTEISVYNQPISNEPSSNVSVCSEPVRNELDCTEPVPGEPIKEKATHVDELAAVGKVLQLLEHQLHGVNQDVEESVAGVCSGFNGMAQRAQAAVASARSATVGNTEEDDALNPLDEMQQVLEALLAAVQSSCRFSQTAAEKLSQLEKRLGGVEKIVVEVEDIAGRAKMVALNGRIEASRLGAAGKAFGVVAQETKDLADKASQTGQSIRESINALATELFQTTGEMRSRAGSDKSSFEQTDSAVRHLLTKLEQTHCQMSTAIATTASISVELQNDVGKAVMSMQFQDRVSQRVAHVVETLAGLVERIDPWCAEANSAESQRYFDLWQAEMASRYTMDSERYAGSEGEAHVAQPTANEPVVFDVELF